MKKTKTNIGLSILFLLVVLLVPSYSSAQTSKYAYTYEYKIAQSSFDNMAYKDAIRRYEKLVKKGWGDDLVKHNLVLSYYKVGDMVKAEQELLKLIEAEKATTEEVEMYIQALKINEKYAEADVFLRDTPKGISDLVDSLKKEEKYVIEAMPFNSSEADFAAVPFNRGKEIVFVSARKSPLLKSKSAWDESPYLKIYTIPLDGSKSPKSLSSKFCSSYHDGPICFNTSGNEAYFTQNVKGDNGELRLAIVYSRKSREKGWSEPIVLSLCDPKYSYGHPSFDNKKRILYFMSDMPGGFGGTDIYEVKNMGRNKWKEPVNLGSEVNTPQNEVFPFMGENRKLYFSSNGHDGLGGLDIYSAHKSDTSYFVKNMGYPVNSSSDDFSLYIDKKGKKGYFASNRPSNVGAKDNIYSLSLIEKEPSLSLWCTVTDAKTGDEVEEPVTVLKEMNAQKEVDDIAMVDGAGGKTQFEVKRKMIYKIKVSKEGYFDQELVVNTSNVLNKQTVVNYSIKLKPLPIYGIYGTIFSSDDASPIDQVEVVLRKGDNSEVKFLTDSVGAFRGQLAKNTDYKVIVRKQGFIPKVFNYTTTGKKEGWVNVNDYIEAIVLEEVKIGKSMVIFYDVGQSELDEKGVPELEDMARFLTDNVSLRIELGAHTDARGSKEFNQELSEKRAESVVRYLVSKGVDANRIEAHGYGESQLKNKCGDGVDCTEEEHQQNRRCEAKIVGM